MSYFVVYVFEPGDDGKGRIEDGDHLATGKGWLGWGDYALAHAERFPQCAHLAEEGTWPAEDDGDADWGDLEHEAEQLTHADDPNVAAVSARLLAGVKGRPGDALALIVGDGTGPGDDDGDDNPTTNYGFDPAKHPRGQPDNAGQFGPGGGGKTDTPSAGRADLKAWATDSRNVPPDVRDRLTSAAASAKTRRKVLHRVAPTVPAWRPGEVIDLPATAFTGLDVTTGRAAGAIGWKSSDAALVVIESPARGLDIDYRALDVPFDVAGEQETIAAGRYRVKEIRRVPEPGTDPNDGYTVPQYVLAEV